MHSGTFPSSEPKPPRPRRNKRYRQIVTRIEDMALTRAEGPFRIDDLCSTAGVSGRATLRRSGGTGKRPLN